MDAARTPRSFEARLGPGLRRFLGQTPVPLWIDGSATPAADGGVRTIRYPATGEPVAAVSNGTVADARAAVAAARAAFDTGSWPRCRGGDRGLLLDRLADRIEEAAEDFAVVGTLETGKSITEARGDVARAVDGLRFYGAAARNNRGETIVVDARRRARTHRVPLGVVAAIVPWNVPLVLTVSKIAPALAVGNTVVVKPSEPTPLSALLLAELAGEIGFPPGVVNVVTGLGAEVGDFLARCPDVDGVTFTGGTRTGESVGAAAVASHKRMQLELGGKSANIVFADADLDAAVAGAASGAFYGQGQICSAGSRLLVQRGVYDRFVSSLVREAEAIRVGDPFDPATRMGSLISRAHRDGVLRRVEEARALGAKVETGGAEATVPGHPDGAFMAPTILTGVAIGSPAEQEEIFGPVVVVIPFDDEDEAVAIANGTRYGLAAGVWTASASRASRVAGRMKTGVVWINCYNQFDPLVPFGGVKHSGGGSREWSHLAMDCFLEVQTIWEVS